ncbi:SEN1 N terminal-domain-containing protein [Lipomyces doorenjongii]|uniref:SEN1 N terminal-domain-containing protein n=1 Tax=Lipomyces doorenjongii TaxID=383834 RepID=UPI0034CD7717
MASANDKNAMDDELQRVSALVEESQRRDDPGLQETALQDSLAYLMKLPKTSHFFCNEKRRVLAVNALQMFAFPPTPELDWLKVTMGRHLNQCFLCVKAYQKAKVPLITRFLELGFDKENVDEFMHLLNAWDIDRLATALEPSAAKCREATAAGKAVDGKSIQDSFNALYECLYAPNLISESTPLSAAFHSVFLGVQAGGRFLRLSKEIVPAMISFLFLKGEPELVRWAEKSIGFLERKVGEMDFDPCNRRAYHDAVGRYLAAAPTRTAEDVTFFWKAMHRVLGSVHKSVILNHCCGNSSGGSGSHEDNIVKMAWLDLQAFPACFPVLLPVFGTFFGSLGGDMWPASTPFIPTSMLDIVLGSAGSIAFEKALQAVATQDLKALELLNWVQPFVESLSGSNKLKCSEILASRFLGRYQDPVQFGTTNTGFRIQLLLTGLRVLNSLLDFGQVDTSDMVFRVNSNSVDKLMRREARKVAETYASLIIETAIDDKADSALRTAARNVLDACIVLDSVSTADESEVMTDEILTAAVMKQRDITQIVLTAAEDEAAVAELGVSGDGASLLCYGEGMWELLKEKMPYNDIEFARFVVRSIAKSRVYLAEPLDSMRMPSGTSAGASSNNASMKLISLKVKKFNDLSTKIDGVLTALANLLQHISDFGADKLQKELLIDEPTVEVLLCLSLSAHSGLSRYSLEIVKQAYDASGRLECLRGLFGSNPAQLLRAYVATIKHTGAVSTLFGLGPVPRLVRTTMDVAALLFDPRDGYVATHNSAIPDTDVRTAAHAFWTSVWRALTYIFKRTLTWARAYPKDIMVDYMRDVLDLSSTLFENIQLLEQALTSPSMGLTVVELQSISPSKPTTTGLDLLSSLIEPLREMCPWLRLSDAALLTVCVRLVCGILNRFSKAKVDVPKDILKKLEKLSQQTGRHYNNLTDAQCYDLVIALSLFDEQPLDEIKSESPDTVPNKVVVKGERASPFDDVHAKPVKVSSKVKGGLDAWLEKGHKKESAAKKEVYDLESDEEASLLKEFETAEKAKARQRIDAMYNKIKAEEKPAPKPSLLSARRQEISEQRQKTAVTTATAKNDVIHPPRPAGFRVAQMGAPSSRSASSSRPVSGTTTAVSSDEASSGESDNDIDSLFSLSKHHRPVPKPVVAAQLAPQPLKISSSLAAARRRQFGPPSMTEKERAERNMRARLRVNLDPLYHRILRWDYHSEKELPSDEVGSDLNNYKAVPNKFPSAVEYKAVFEPLLMLECVQNIVKTKEERMDKPFRLSITNRVSCDEYIDVYASIEAKILPNIKIGEMDVVVISYVPEDQEIMAGSTAAGQDRPARWPNKQYLNCMAKIKEIKRSNQAGLSDVVLRCLPKPDMARHLVPRTDLSALRVMGMTTIEREYSSLQGLPYYDLCDQILHAKPASSIRADATKIRKTQSTYNVNAPQAGAIIAAMESTGFTLIQGPPGTGKTKTILGIIGATLTTTKSRGIPIQIPGQRHSGQQQASVTVEPKRILVCAPSNAAVDELVLRLKGGIWNSSGEIFFPRIVRLGRSDIINPAVRDLTLEELVDAQIGKFEQENNAKSGGGIDRVNLRDQLNKVLAERAEVDREIAMTEEATARDKLRAQRDMLNAKKAALGQRLDEERDRHAVVVRTNEIERRNIQTRILTNAEVMCATLSGAGHDLLASLSMTFETVIIDEAAQCVELSALIPLKYGCIRCAMVGDPNQLPPTVLSQTASKFQYEQSLFVRMQRNFPSSVHLLSIQYRMHPQISQFPSAQFYDSRLIDGDGMEARTEAEWHSTADIFGPYRFFNVHSREQQSKSTHSYYNKMEALCAVALYRQLTESFPKLDLEGRVGIVTPYKQQLHELRNTFRSALGNTGMHGIDFNTIDGFQGQEKDIIILSCVRAQAAGGAGGSVKGVGFLADIRRMNVALTRAKSSLWIIGNMQSLVVNDVWRKLIEDAQKRGLVSQFDGERFKVLDAAPVVPQKRRHNHA